MNNKAMRGAIIRGAMAMQTPVIIIFFKECCADNFQANWDDLTSVVQQFWIELAGQLEGIIGSELWKSTIEDNLQELADRDQTTQVKDLCTKCASENCSHMWKWGKKCCPDCSHVKPLPSNLIRNCE